MLEKIIEHVFMWKEKVASREYSAVRTCGAELACC